MSFTGEFAFHLGAVIAVILSAVAGYVVGGLVVGGF